jgi:uncharacterized membrane protein
MSDQPTHTISPPLLTELRARRKAIRNVNEVHEEGLSPMNRLAVWITERVGTMGFFFMILIWTVVWCGYNILASEVKALHWTAFDPFPAFVAYLLISNVIQILLMPLIMVGQNVQGQHSELRAQSDFEINCKAEQEIEAILQHLEYQQAILIQLAGAQGIKLDTLLSRVKPTQGEGTHP